MAAPPGVSNGTNGVNGHTNGVNGHTNGVNGHSSKAICTSAPEFLDHEYDFGKS